MEAGWKDAGARMQNANCQHHVRNHIRSSVRAWMADALLGPVRRTSCFTRVPCADAHAAADATPPLALLLAPEPPASAAAREAAAPLPPLAAPPLLPLLLAAPLLPGGLPAWVPGPGAAELVRPRRCALACGARRDPQRTGTPAPVLPATAPAAPLLPPHPHQTAACEVEGRGASDQVADHARMAGASLCSGPPSPSRARPAPPLPPGASDPASPPAGERLARSSGP